MFWAATVLLCVQACVFAALWKRARGDAKWWRKMYARARELGASRYAELTDARAEIDRLSKLYLDAESERATAVRNLAAVWTRTAARLAEIEEAARKARVHPES